MRKVLKLLTLTIVIIGTIVLIILLLIRITPLPPVGEMNYARETLSKAGANRADTYSRKLFSEAKAFYDSAMVNWHRENERFIFIRNYDKVAIYAALSVKKAKQANENSVTSSGTLKVKLKDKLDSLNDIIIDIDKLFNRYPLPAEIRSRIAKGKFLLKEGEVAYRKGQYLFANRKINDAEYLLKGVYDNETTNLKNYLESHYKWKKWTDATIADSRKNSSCSIIIDKFSRKCYIYLNGERKYEFDAELGRNWIGDKRKSGDKATPEGIYKIITKFKGKDTEYYKALLIDYPNLEDKQRFKTEVSNGTLPKWAKIGSGIEIHGGGGKGVDWTEGCIALKDSEMDLVYNLTKIGTPVTIVGSLKNIQQILER
jgi:L,D-peptidoglycan transpeptidase YkuD (ErfK/YbiS/YcfS/YnhG family)